MADTTKSTSAEGTSGFSKAERAAMKERAEELRSSGRGGKKKADELQAALDKIAEMPDADRALAERVHATVLKVAPELGVKTRYGMPTYTRDGKVLCFFQAASTFDTRYSTFGFDDIAQLDDGPMWPTSYALVEWTPDVEARITELVATAVG